MTIVEFNQEYDRLDSVLTRFATSLTRNQEEAKDLMQETVFLAYGNRTKFKVGTNFKAWIMTIMRNTYISAYRKKKNAIASTPSYDFDASTSLRHSINNNAPSNIRVAEINSRVNQLSDLYRIPFIMFYQGYRYDEIANHLGVPMGTVKSRIFSARKKLRLQLAHVDLTARA